MGTKGYIEKTSKGLRFVPPRDDHGKFLPQEFWSQRELKEHRKVKRENAPKRNPIIKTKPKKARKSRRVYVPPRDDQGRFLPQELWDKKEKKEFERALDEGLFDKPKKRGKRKTAKGRKSYDEIVSAITKLQRELRKINKKLKSAEEAKQAPRQLYSKMIAPRKLLEETRQAPLAPVKPLDIEELDDEQKKMLLESAAILEASNLTKKGTAKKVLIKLTMPKKYPARGYRGVTKKEEAPLSEIERLTHLYKINPSSADSMLVRLVDKARENPLLAAVIVGVVVFVVTGIIKSIINQVRARKESITVWKSEMQFPGSSPYFISTKDRLWMARALWADVSQSEEDWMSNKTKETAAAVLWALGNRYMTVEGTRNVYPVYADFIEHYVSNLNPDLLDFTSEACTQNPHLCTPEKNQLRLKARNMEWQDIPLPARIMVDNFTAGFVKNPIGTRNEFCEKHYDYKPHDGVALGELRFGTNPNTMPRRRW